jgi:hypothetical protein
MGRVHIYTRRRRVPQLTARRSWVCVEICSSSPEEDGPRIYVEKTIVARLPTREAWAEFIREEEKVLSYPLEKHGLSFYVEKSRSSATHRKILG